MIKKKIIETYPYPVAKPYSIIGNNAESPQQKLWSLPFTLYQSLRIVTLPLVSQYLNNEKKIEDFSNEELKSVKSINEAIARIRCPFFSDWIGLYLTLSKHMPKLFSKPFFPLEAEGLKEKVEIPEAFFDLKGNRSINRMEAILALRNAMAHGGQLPVEKRCKEIIDFYFPMIDFILEKFSFLGKTSLLVMTDEEVEDYQDSVIVRNLKGVEPPEPEEMEIDDELREYFKNSVVMKNEKGEYMPLYPLFIKRLEDEPVYAYDGHHSIRQDEKIKEAYIYYLGVFDKKALDSSFEDLKEKLERKKIVWSISKQACAPWTLSDSCYDYSERTYGYMLNTKYFPSCYEVPSDMERHFERFLKSGEEFIGKEKDKKSPKHFLSGLILLGSAGTGKTAFLTYEVEKLLKFHKEYNPVQDAHIARYSEHLTFFLRGDGIIPGAVNILFRNIVEKIGIKTEDFRSFSELFKKLQDEWKKDKIKGRTFVIILDALNESSLSFPVFENALELIETASEYPWCKVIISLREEFFSTWYGRLKDKDVTRTNPLIRLSRETGCLYYIPKLESDPLKKMEEDHPVLTLEPLSEEVAKKVYENYQREACKEKSSLKACTSSWDELKETTRRILHNPLMLHLYNQTYGGKKGFDLNNSGKVYSEYINSLYERKPALRDALSQIIECMISSGSSYLTEADYHKIRKAWAEKKTVSEGFVEISPIELAVTEGLIRKRVEYEGGGYNFIYQKILEYVIYRYLRDKVPGENAEAYWLMRVKEEVPFPEYGSSFSFLFRNLYESDKYSFMVKLVEDGVENIKTALESFLEGHIREEETRDISEKLKEFVKVAYKEGWENSWYVLNNIAREFSQTVLSSISHLFYKGSIATSERIYKKDPLDIVNVTELVRNYGNLGLLLQTINRKEEALEYYEKAIGILKLLHKKDPENILISHGLANTYGNLGLLGNCQ